jgi:hypothetical protein
VPGRPCSGGTRLGDPLIGVSQGALHGGGVDDAVDLPLGLASRHHKNLDEVSAVRLEAPHEDVAAALSHGFDGDRTLLEPSPVPVI